LKAVSKIKAFTILMAYLCIEKVLS
jgi:hypothetical protein